jgi:hypothetical protein
MKRRLFNLAAAVSLVVFIAVAALWVRSYWEGYALRYVAQPPEGPLLTWTYVARGTIWVGRMESGRYSPGWGFERFPRPGGVSYTRELLPGPILGFGYMPWTAPGSMYGIAMPLWSVLLCAVPLPAWRMMRTLQRRARRTGGLCPTCGYDLRATPQGGRCPECGTVPQAIVNE